MTDMVLKGRRLSAEVVRLIVERTDGIPLFVEELTRMLLDTHLIEVEGELVLKAGTDLSKIPSSVRDSLVGRLTGLARPIRPRSSRRPSVASSRTIWSSPRRPSRDARPRATWRACRTPIWFCAVAAVTSGSASSSAMP